MDGSTSQSNDVDAERNSQTLSMNDNSDGRSHQSAPPALPQLSSSVPAVPSFFFGPGQSLPNNYPTQQQLPNIRHVQHKHGQHQTLHGTPPLRPQHPHGLRTARSEDSSDHQQPPEQRLQLPPPRQQLQQQQQQSRSTRQGYRRHRKSQSSNAALSNGGAGSGAYGSFWGQPQHTSSSPPPPSFATTGGHIQQHVRRGSWGYQQQAPLLRPPSPVSQSSPRSAMTKSLDPRVNELRSLSASLGMSPRSSPKMAPGNVLASVPEHLLAAPQQQPLILPPAVPAWALNSNSNMINNNNSIGSTGSNQLRRSIRSESHRRKHMRTHSAQLAMESTKGTQQRLECRDVGFLVLFVVHLLCVVYLGNLYFDYAIFTRQHEDNGDLNNGGRDLRRHSVNKTTTISVDVDDDTNDGSTDLDAVVIHYENLLYMASLCGAFAMSLSAILLGIMTLMARRLVQVALVLIVTLSFVWGTIGIGLSPHNFVPITGIIALALSVAYAVIVWDRIPFASANVLSALTALRIYPTLTVLALLFQAIALVWSIYFCVVTIGVYDAIQEGNLVMTRGSTIALYSALGVSYYWTFQVLSNTLKACTASVIGSWWHGISEPGVVSKAVFKTLFYSMGSICYGSLFVEPVGIIRQIAIIFRPSTVEDATLICFHECMRLAASGITSLVDSLTSRFNHWAFTYIGLYNYGFSDAAHRAAEVFEKRGWTIIVSDDLVPNILLITSLVVGGMTGCFAGLLEWVDVLPISSLNEPGLVSFTMGTVIGIVLSSILFGLIHSSANTVLVCFAVEPMDFQENHPQLSDEMREAWREVWPGALDVVDLHLAMAHAQRSPSPLPPLESAFLLPPVL